MLRKVSLAIVLALLFAPRLASAVPPPPGWGARSVKPTKPQKPQKMQPAAKIERIPSTSLTLRVGEKRSFGPVEMAGCSDPKVIKCQTENFVLTVRGVRAGRAIIMPSVGQATKGPPQLIQTTVTE
jgi:hypothetical protein